MSKNLSTAFSIVGCLVILLTLSYLSFMYLYTEVQIAYMQAQVAIFEGMEDQVKTVESVKSAVGSVEYALYYYPGGHAKMLEGTSTEFLLETLRRNSVRRMVATLRQRFPESDKGNTPFAWIEAYGTRGTPCQERDPKLYEFYKKWYPELKEKPKGENQGVSGIWVESDRVALGDCSPGAPTDPCVRTLPHTAPQDFVSPRVSRTTSFSVENAVDDLWNGQWKSCQKKFELFPYTVSFAMSITEPSLTDTADLTADTSHHRFSYLFASSTAFLRTPFGASILRDSLDISLMYSSSMSLPFPFDSTPCGILTAFSACSCVKGLSVFALSKKSFTAFRMSASFVRFLVFFGFVPAGGVGGGSFSAASCCGVLITTGRSFGLCRRFLFTRLSSKELDVCSS